MVGFGINQDMIAAIIGISDETLRKYYRAHLDTGKAKCVEKVAGSLFDTAMGGDVQAQKFYLSAQAGWSDKQQVQHANPDGSPVFGVNVTLSKPGTPSEAG